MRSSFKSGILIGGVVGAAISMIANHDIDMKKTKKRMIRIGRNMVKKSRRWMSDIAAIMN